MVQVSCLSSERRENEAVALKLETTWDPGGAHLTNRNDRIFDVLIAANEAEERMDEAPRTELDSHTNTLVVGKNGHILVTTGK